MKGSRAGTRYAKALIGQAKDQSILESIYNDVLLIQKALEESDDLVLLLESPIVKTEKKIIILNKIFKGKLNDLTLKFLQMLTEQKREAALPSVIRSFIDIYNEEHGIATVYVTTATELTNDNRKQLIKNLKEEYNFNSIDLRELIDENLIGGMIIRIGDKQMDESIRRKLNEIHQELINA